MLGQPCFDGQIAGERGVQGEALMHAQAVPTLLMASPTCCKTEHSPTAALRLEHLAMRKITKIMLRPQAITFAMLPSPLPPPPFWPAPAPAVAWGIAHWGLTPTPDTSWLKPKLSSTPRLSVNNCQGQDVSYGQDTEIRHTCLVKRLQMGYEGTLRQSGRKAPNGGRLIVSS